MRHVFKIPELVKDAVKQRVKDALDEVPPERYNQEPPYVAALLNRLASKKPVYDGPDGLVIFESTTVDDRGRGSPESEFGADFAITATISDMKITVKKAILGQAKRCPNGQLSAAIFKDLTGKITDMRRYTRNPKVLLLDEYDGRRIPRVVSGNIILQERNTKGYSLENYFTIA
jgi:hypothetical protein